MRSGSTWAAPRSLAGLIDTDTGTIVSTAVQPTRADHGPDNVLTRLLAVAEDAVNQSNVSIQDVKAIGIGAAGQVDSECGTPSARPIFRCS